MSGHRRWLVGTAVVGVGIAAGAARAAYIEAGAPFVFQDDFSVADPGNEPVDAKWNGGNNDTQDRINVVGGLMVINDDTGSDAFIDTDPLNFAGATEWATEFRIRFGENNANDNGIIVIGGVFASNWNDFRIHYGDGATTSTFDLQWDNGALIGPATDELVRGEFYSVVIHHKPDGFNDFYIGPDVTNLTLAGTKSHLFTSSPSAFLRTGDPGTVGRPFYDYDYLEIGAVTVPEPASLALLAMSGVAIFGGRRR